MCQYRVGYGYLLSRGQYQTYMTRSVPAFSVLIILAALLFAFPAYASHNNNDWDDDDRIPSCWIKASPNTVHSSGNSITLSWDSSYADRAYITDIGDVGTRGSQSINVYAPKTYRMTVYNDGRSEDCETLVNVLGYSSYNYSHPNYTYGNYGYNNYYYNQPYYTPPAQYISLTQIPYTGFDFGPLGNSIYWFTLFALAIFAAYLLIYQSGMRALATLPVINETIRAGKLQIAVAREVFSRAAKAEARSSVASVQALPVAEQRLSGDTMHIVKGQQPRLVITRE